MRTFLPDFRAILRRTSIRWLILGFYVVILLVTLGILSLGIYIMVGRFLWHTSETRLRSAIYSVWFTDNDDGPTHRHHLKGRGLPVPADFPKGSDDLVQRISGRGVFARILDPSGRIIAQTAYEHEAPPVDQNQIQSLFQATESGSKPRVTYLARAQREWQVILLPIRRPNQTLVGILQVGGLYRPTRDLMAALTGYLVIGGLVAFGLALVVSWAVSRFLAHPLEQLLGATRLVRSGDLSARTNLKKGTNEIYTVAAAFDKMVEQLQETFNAQRRFVADASHELKTPLTAIGGMAEVLRVGADRGKPEQRERALATIEKEVDRMSALVSDLLTLSRAEQTCPSVPVRVMLQPLVQDVVSQISMLAPDHKISHSVPASAAVMADPEQFDRILRNLVENAVQYSPAGARIQVESTIEGEWMRVDVKDQGIGISEQDLPHIFDRFYRADRSRARKTGGSGLGLAIVSALVEQNAGRVSAASRPGEGSVFTLHLPVAQL